MQRKSLGMLVAAAAAYGIYKYSKMSPEQKNNLKAKGRDFLDKNFSGLGNLFGKKQMTSNGNNY
jgi:hypothetical protein